MSAFAHMHPRSGKKVWKMPGISLSVISGKFRKNEKSQGIKKKNPKKLMADRLLKVIISINRKQFIFRNIPFLIYLV